MSVVRLESGDETREVRLSKDFASVDGARVGFREVRRDGELVALQVEENLLAVRVAREGNRIFVWCAGEVFEIRRESSRASRAMRAAAGDHGTGLLAPMPGRIRKTPVQRGERVSKGDVVLVLEAMKMEHAIRAPRDGVVTRLDHREGDLVDAGAVLAEIL
jgi:acetyl/propionyl-CoA carboxylase alpha subunit